MAPNVKDSAQENAFMNNSNNRNFNVLKAFLHFSIQVSTGSRDGLGIQELLKPSKIHEKKCVDGDTLPLIWVTEDGENNSSSSDGSSEFSSSGTSSRKNSSDSDCSSSCCSTGSSRKNSKEIGGSRISLPKCWTRRRRPTSFKRSKSKEISDKSTIFESVDQMTTQQHLAFNALHLTAPATGTALQEQQNFVQLSGHKGSLKPVGCGKIRKKTSGSDEASVYESLMKDSAKTIVPKFFGKFDENDENYIEISDLLEGFKDPCLIDIKMGTRTFMESEANNPKPRTDLYEKMMKVDPSSILPEEHEDKNMTKLRYMNLRDILSSSRELGFRLEALKMCDESNVTQMKTLKKAEIVDTLSAFVRKKDCTRIQILERLENLRNTFESSNFFGNHEVIGSSVLIVYDETKAGAWMIDFAKTKKLPEGLTVNHRDEWFNGNHEEGYLLGLDNLIEYFKKLEAT